ncbi:MAG: bifunctional isocitrate dehydrogenase kinase/phosphatase [Gammaproteobacteria bacterium]|nr:bifunctional isocitrate dehydrogenase kinase/phosphatase [Gammaproteobacteria bacterium]
MTATAGSLIDHGARRIAAAFAAYNGEFRDITRRAPQRFEARDWHGSQQDAVERIELYDKCVNRTVAELRQALGAEATHRELWSRMRERFHGRTAGLPDAAFARTFFSSVSRRIFGTVGVDPGIEFVGGDLDPLEGAGEHPETQVYINRGSVELVVEDLLGELRLRAPWIAFEKSVHNVAAEITRRLRAALPNGVDVDAVLHHIEVLRPLFFQSTRAYLVGQVVSAGARLPLLLALQNTERGLFVDTVMLDEDELSIVFGFTRSYFHVDLERVVETVVFLRQLLPRKPLSELFTVLGRARQGKTERYLEIVRHLQQSSDLFVHAAGERGLVMVCFTLPSLDVVFKLIRDRFPPVKTVLRQDVIDKYKFVFRHDRAGRLVDAQEFRRVRLPRSRFSPELIEELLDETADTVHVDGDDLVFDHMYIERRMVPLNLYLRDAAAEAADKAVVDYGQAIRDLALSNIFAGDLLLKNFGVTRHGRVIFYDYDELCQVTDCRFREVPQASNDEDEMRGEAWFYVAENDVFPETFLNFLAFTDPQRELFQRTHGDLLEADFWRGIQQRVREGAILEILPYRPRRAVSSLLDPG